MHLPTLVVTVRRGFPSDDALLGISFRTMATVLSAALESFPYNSKINNDLCQDSLTTYSFLSPSRGLWSTDFHVMKGNWLTTETSTEDISTRLWQWEKAHHTMQTADSDENGFKQEYFKFLTQRKHQRIKEITGIKRFPYFFYLKIFILLIHFSHFTLQIQ